jgi:uncharacterized protein (TIGR02996 family)
MALTQGNVVRSLVRNRGRKREFWAVLLHVLSPGYTLSAGTTGAGEKHSFECPNAAAARAEVDRVVAEKLAEGFVETTDHPFHGGFDSPTRQALEQALAEDPDDLAAHSAHADHLSELGDPRGEFIQIQLSLERDGLDPEERKKLRRREKALLTRHQREWLGPLAGFWLDRLDSPDWMSGHYDANALGWRRGWVDSLSFDGCSPHAVEAVKRSLPRLRLLQKLRIISALYDEHRYSFSDLSGVDFLGSVRVLQVGDDSHDQNFIGDAVSESYFYREMPRLEELHLYNGSTPFAKPFPHLKKLTAHHGREVHNLGVLAANESLKNLTHLSIWPRGQSNDFNEDPNEDGGWAYVSRSGAAALFRSPNLTRLQHLTLRNSDTGDEGIRVLIESGMLRRLKTLDLLGGCVTDEGARLLADCPDLRNLECLNLSENMIGPSGLAALRPTGVKLTASHQFGPEALHTRRYLYSGDCE